MPTKIVIPRFKSEAEEAQWWDAHPEVVTALFLKAKKEGRLERLPRIRGATKSVTIRLPITDLETAQEIADQRELPTKPSSRPPSSGAGAGEQNAINPPVGAHGSSATK
jgi:hypothetical protein